MRCAFIPPYLQERLVGTAPPGSPGLAATPPSPLTIDQRFRAAREQHRVTGRSASHPADGGWTVHTADNGSDLPGRPVRSRGEPVSGDLAVDEASTGIDATQALLGEVYDRFSYDDAGAHAVAVVHYERNYNNAFWDGSRLVFGDGDGRIFERFTKPIDVLGHEMFHAVVEYSAGLVYQGQSGALNESVCDVFASCMKQRMAGQEATDGDWLIGAGLFRPGVEGRGLRSMSEPGTAYDDPRLGSDPQVGHLDNYIETTDDNGGVHLNSGIPNRAFYLAATRIGGSSAENAGRIWYAALTGEAVGAQTDFAGFAAATVAAAGSEASVVAEAWAEVGLDVGGPAHPGPPRSDSPSLPDSPPPTKGTVHVRRTGGIVGRSVDGEVELDSDDPRAPQVRELVARIDFAALHVSQPRPDVFVYHFWVGRAQPAVVGETDLTDDLRRLARIVLKQ